MTTSRNDVSVLLLIALTVFPSWGQQGNPPPIKGMGSTVGLYVYPQKAQNATQQLTDESQCYDSAKTQTGFDPDATTKGAKDQAQSDKKDHGAARGAARGAAISGAVGADAAEGAARGAVLGGVRSKRKEKQQDEQAEKQADASKTQEQQQMDKFKRSMSACLDALGYSVR